MSIDNFFLGLTKVLDPSFEPQIIINRVVFIKELNSAHFYLKGMVLDFVVKSPGYNI